jgi:hypothetical protein
MRAVPLTAIKAGISRQRVKASARADQLFDLLNAYVTAAQTIEVRPGTVRDAQVPNTKGLTAFRGELHVFSHEQVSVPAGFVLHVLAHPSGEPDAPALEKIHFAEPFLGFLYVVAEFADGGIYHFWLQSGGTWEANKVYRAGDIVEPSTPNGLAYEATRASSPFQSWAASVPRAEGDRIEPTTYNGFYYTVVEVAGTNPASGTVEPIWPENPGERVYEDTEGTGSDSVSTTPPAGAQSPTSSVTDRYGDGS